MPNHVRNRVTVSGPDADVAALVALVQDAEQEFSFQRVIPMPSVLSRIHTGGTTINGQSASRWYEREENGETVNVAISEAEADQLVAKYGAPDWYAWAIKNWGTKWDAYDVSAEIQPGRAIYEFHSAWSPPVPVIEELSRRFPSLTIRVVCDGEVDQPFSFTVKAGVMRP